MSIRHDEKMIVNGRLNQIGKSFRSQKYYQRSAVFQCACGNKTVAKLDHVKSGHTMSCGCFNGDSKATHRASKTPTYKSWSAMMRRCYSEKNTEWSRYGGRGIKVSEELITYQGFVDCMGERPHGTSIDRLDVNGDYTAKNCRWATATEQARNRRNNVLVTIGNETKTVAEWAEHPKAYGNKRIYKRVESGVTGSKAVFGN